MEESMRGFTEQGEPTGRGHGHGPDGHSGHGGRGGGRGGRGFGRGFGRPGGWQQADLPAADDVDAWLAGRLPGDWFTAAATVEIDREEITVTGPISPPEYPANADDAAKRAADAGRIGLFREQTREARMQIANEAEARYSRKIAWGASIGDTNQLFSHLAVPVMTRLRQPDRQVLDTLVDAGVARSRSEALAWCVRLVGEHTDDWLSGLRAAMSEVDKLRTEGPGL